MIIGSIRGFKNDFFVVRYTQNLSGDYQLTEIPPSLPRFPKRLATTQPIREDIQQNANSGICLEARGGGIDRGIFTCLRSTSIRRLFLGDKREHPKKERNKFNKSILLVHFSEDNQDLTLFYFKGLSHSRKGLESDFWDFLESTQQLP